MILTPHGYYKDVLIRSSGERVEYPWRHNQIQNNFAKLLAGLSIGYNFGGGVGVGVNQIAFGRGRDEWFAHALPEPQSHIEGGTAARLVIPNSIFPLTIPDGGGTKLVFDGDKTVILGPYTGAPVIGSPAVYWATDVVPQIDALLAGKGRQGGGPDSWWFESLTTGPSSTVELLSPVGESGITADMFAGVTNRFAVGTTEDSTVYGGEYDEPVLDPDSNVLADEFATQLILPSELQFMDPDLLIPSSAYTRVWQCRVLRGQTAQDEVHGEFGLYGAYNSLTNNRLMVDWVARPQRITKRTNDILETTVIMVFFKN